MKPLLFQFLQVLLLLAMAFQIGRTSALGSMGREVDRLDGAFEVLVEVCRR